MERIQVIHSRSASPAAWIDDLPTLGYTIDARPLGREVLEELRASPPSAVVIDLDRAPSQGRDVAVSIRTYKATRTVPIVFIGGNPQKVAQVQALLPDATYTVPDDIGAALSYAIAHSLAEPVVPESVMAAYGGTPLVKKLGIGAGATVALEGAPSGFEQLLVGLPADARVCRDATVDRGMTLWFVRSQAELESRVAEMGSYAENGGLWIIWPKKASGVRSYLSQTVVRRIGLSTGLVDFKVCSVDPTWSGLRFSIRKPE